MSPEPPDPIPPRRALRAPGGAALALVLALMAGAPVTANAATPAELLAGWQSAAGRPASAAAGRTFFNTSHGREWRCASCHGESPTVAGRHAATGKVIRPLAPAFDAERFTEAAKAEKWFRRNCGDVLGRTCTDGEKADVLAWLMTMAPTTAAGAGAKP